jgi:hypothetical protein
MIAATGKRRRFCVGDNVRFTFGTLPVTGEIVEDRGPLGADGGQIVRVRLDMDPYEPMFFEMPVTELEHWDQPEAPLTVEEIQRYLMNGGLLLMLPSSPKEGEPRVWLRRDHLGNVTHTFIEKRGMVGGAIPPSAVRTDVRIRATRRDAVREFIKSFGLSNREADDVIRKVGTAN